MPRCVVCVYIVIQRHPESPISQDYTSISIETDAAADAIGKKHLGRTVWHHKGSRYPPARRGSMKAVASVLLWVAAQFVVMPRGTAQTVTPPPGSVVCTSCHGAHGEGSTTGVPRLAGQNPEYMSHALSMFKAGTRSSPIMEPIAQGLTNSDMDALTRYFSNQSPPLVDTNRLASATVVLAGKQLAEVGPAACFSCHGAGGKGNGTRYPSIAGQPARFIADRIHEFQQRAREKTPQPGTMTAVSTTLSEDQIKASAAYLSRLRR
jgi:cytochrome c553